MAAEVKRVQVIEKRGQVIFWTGWVRCEGACPLPSCAYPLERTLCRHLLSSHRSLPPPLCVTKHPHALHLGRYSVHTSAATLAAGEAEIRHVGTLLKQQGIFSWN